MLDAAGRRGAGSVPFLANTTHAIIWKRSFNDATSSTGYARPADAIEADRIRSTPHLRSQWRFLTVPYINGFQHHDSPPAVQLPCLDKRDAHKRHVRHDCLAATE